MKKELTPSLAFIPILSIIVAASLAVFIWDIEMHIPLAVGVIAAAAVAIAKGWKWREVETMMIRGVSRGLPAVFILMIVGTIIGTWIASGVIPTIVYYGLSMIDPSIFVPLVALVTGIISVTLGSSFTSMATIGIAFMAIGSGLDFSPGIVAGAVISGAFFGDKISPVSDTTNVAPAVAETDLFSHIKHMLWDTLPAFGLSILLYWVITNTGSGAQTGDIAIIDNIQSGLNELFLIHPLLLLMPVLMIILMVKRLPAIPTLLVVSFLGALLAIFVQGMAPSAVMEVITGGFESISEVDEVNELLSQGGLFSMFETIALLMIATALGGILEETGAFAVLTRKMMNKVQKTRSLITSTLFSTFVVAFACGEMFISIILPARTFADKYKEMGIDTKNLSRAVEAVGTVGINLVPWGVTVVFASELFNIAPMEFIPYTFLAMLVPLINLFFGFTGWTITKRTYPETKPAHQSEQLDEGKAV